MFILDYKSLPYYDPWSASYEKRMKKLLSGDIRVAYFYENPDNSTFRYRVYNMIQVLQKSSHNVSSSYFCNGEEEKLVSVIDMVDVLVICRTKYSDKINRLISSAKSKGKKVLFDIDDLIFNATYTHLILNTLDQQLSHPNVWDVWFASISRCGETLRLCDAVITTNEFLATQIHNFSSKSVYVIPNFLNDEQMRISTKIFQQKISSGFQRDQSLTLGYFSGTPTHNKDFALISNALIHLFQKYPNIVLRIVGYLDLKGDIENYSSRIEFFPLQDFVNLQYLIGSTEINLMPLQDNIFTNCKSELKFFEASIVGTLSIASPVFTYAQAINNGINGYLSNSFEWFHKLDNIINSLDDYQEIAKVAYKDAEKNYAWYNQIELVENILFGNCESIINKLDNSKDAGFILKKTQK